MDEVEKYIQLVMREHTITSTPILIGTSGMLGSEFRSYFGELDRSFFPLSRPSFDISDRESVRKRLLLLKSLGADSVLNCAAATDVSGIELDPRLANESFRANVLGPRYLAETCEDLGLRLIHFSTDYVYSQHSLDTKIFQDEFPVNLYGTHKLLGEKYIQSTMRSGNYAIVRIGCLYGAFGKKSFLHKFLRNACKAKLAGPETVNVIDFQEATPTSTRYVVFRIDTFLGDNAFSGTFSLSPSGSATRAKFAERILLELEAVGIGTLSGIKVRPVDSESGFLPSTSVLDTMNRTTHLGGKGDISWESDLRQFVALNKSSLKRFLEGCLLKEEGN